MLTVKLGYAVVSQPMDSTLCDLMRSPHCIGIGIVCAAWFGQVHSHTLVRHCIPIFATFINIWQYHSGSRSSGQVTLEVHTI
jgi:hypothetical protein